MNVEKEEIDKKIRRKRDEIQAIVEARTQIVGRTSTGKPVGVTEAILVLRSHRS